MSQLRIAAFGCALAITGSASASPWSWAWIKKNVIDRIEVSGSRTFGYHDYQVEGDREAFNSLNYYGYGDRRWTDVGHISLNGRRVAGVANFQATIDTNRYRDPNAQHVSLDYEEKPFRIHLGDIQGSLLNTNRFATFHKTLKGASVEYGAGRFRVKGIYSESKGEARTISFNGNNTSGPYYLNASQIVPGSEQVEVDGVRLKLLDDYVIRYEYGELTFVNRVIAPTSTIVISFEAYGFNSNRGTVQGASTSYNLGRYGQIGLTAIQQKTGGTGALSTRRELFQGAGPPSTPYFLQLEPLTTQPIRVLLNGVEQIENVHYRFDPDNPTIFFFTFFVPNTSTIEVIYTPKPTSTVNGDREVVGLDYRLPFGRRRSEIGAETPEALRRQKPNGGEIRFYQATGRLKNEASPMRGTARGMDVSYEIGDFRLRGAWRKIPATYVSVETRSFSRNEEAVDFGLEYAKDGLSVQLDGGESDVAIRRTTSGGQVVFDAAHARRFNAAIAYNKIVGEPWRLDLSSLESRTTLGPTRLQTASLSHSRSMGEVNVRFRLENQTGRGPVTEGSTTTVKDVGLQTFGVEATYNPGRAWSLLGRVSASQVEAGGDRGTGRDYSLTATYEPSDRFQLAATYALSDAGQLALLSGFQTGYGLGYNGNGFSSGLSGAFQTGITNLDLINVRARYEPAANLSLYAVAERSETTGSYSSNSRSHRFDLGIDWNVDSRTSLGLSLNRSETEFLESPIRSEATTANLNVASRPTPRFSLTGSVGYLLTGGTSDFQQNNLSLDVTANYLVAPRQRAFAAYRYGHTTGFLPQDDNGFEIGYAYQLHGNLALVGTWRYRNVANLDGNPSGAYRSRGFDIELRFGY